MSLDALLARDAPSTGPAASSPGLRRHRFSVDDYYRMAEAGILPPSARVELLAGEVIDVSPIGSPHASCVDRISALLAARLQGRVQVRVQNPVRLDESSEPEPNLALLRPREDFYAARHPGPHDVLLIVEVSDTSLWVDRRIKAPLYAAAGIPELWLVDLRAGELLVHRGPGPQGWSAVQRLERGQRVALPLPRAAGEPPVEVAIEELLGPAPA